MQIKSHEGSNKWPCRVTAPLCKFHRNETDPWFLLTRSLCIYTSIDLGIHLSVRQFTKRQANGNVAYAKSSFRNYNYEISQTKFHRERSLTRKLYFQESPPVSSTAEERNNIKHNLSQHVMHFKWIVHPNIKILPVIHLHVITNLYDFVEKCPVHSIQYNRTEGGLRLSSFKKQNHPTCAQYSKSFKAIW